MLRVSDNTHCSQGVDTQVQSSQFSQVEECSRLNTGDVIPAEIQSFQVHERTQICIA